MTAVCGVAGSRGRPADLEAVRTVTAMTTTHTGRPVTGDRKPMSGLVRKRPAVSSLAGGALDTLSATPLTATTPEDAAERRITSQTRVVHRRPWLTSLALFGRAFGVGGKLMRIQGSPGSLLAPALARSGRCLNGSAWRVRWQADPNRRERSDRGSEAARPASSHTAGRRLAARLNARPLGLLPRDPLTLARRMPNAGRERSRLTAST